MSCWSDKPTIDDAEADPGIPADLTLRGDIEFRNLDFSYSGADSGRSEVLHSLSLRIPAREQSCDRGADGFWKIDPGESDPAALRCGPGSGSD